MTAETGKTRILLVIAGLPAGGAERQMVLLAKMLDRAAYDVGFLIFNASEKVHFHDLFDMPLWFRALDLSPSKDGIWLVPKLIAGLHRTIVDFKPDIVHTSLNVANHATRFTALLKHWKIPIVSSVRADFRDGYRRHEKILERILWRRSACIICNSDVVRQQLMEDLSIPAGRIFAIPNGIDDGFFRNQKISPPSWWPAGRVALTVGRLSEEKNHLGLIKAVETLDQRKALGDWHFVIIGEGRLEHEIRRRIHDSGLDDIIYLAPPQEDLTALYQAATLLILPSDFEGMSNALLEAMAGGCPAAVTEGANKARIVDDSRGWILTHPLVASLERLLKVGDFERAAKGACAASHIAERSPPAL
jgi:glycosyltransferase involved in cell wall biosynthesis